ncbi:glycosyltransferase family 4 protein [Candidatus Magnetaquicoccus inordinatus]|uniref:glycosyltransferase family 4 protein n=1 Tax=Candidatus Magnetaquicoccus inordinatus TaxID=2496818 RepID=UPI00187D4970|nr:glycosyltransferase family 4 protein [Candidatus Magnetaquicoccus inordinatus]
MNSIAHYLWVAGMAWAISLWFVQRRPKWMPLKEINERSLHCVETPSMGGVAILAAFLIAWLPRLYPSWNEYWGWLLPPLAIVAILSFLDDRQPLSAFLRLRWQALALLLFLYGNGDHLEMLIPEHGSTVLHLGNLVLYFLFMLWMINLYNFMDGMDGLASGMGVIGFAAMALTSSASVNHPFAITALTVSAACLGFWLLNRPPGRLFMGDVGAISLGFLAAALSVWGHSAHLLPWWASLLIFSPFIVDATWTLLRRMCNGSPILQPHREHFYQQKMLAGWAPWKILIFYYTIMLLAAFVVWCFTGE